MPGDVVEVGGAEARELVATGKAVWSATDLAGVLEMERLAAEAAALGTIAKANIAAEHLTQAARIAGKSYSEAVAADKHAADEAAAKGADFGQVKPYETAAAALRGEARPLAVPATADKAADIVPVTDGPPVEEIVEDPTAIKTSDATEDPKSAAKKAK